MSDRAWRRRSLPSKAVGATRVGFWRPVTPAQVTAARLQLGAVLHDGARPPDVAEEGVQRLLLVFEELVSNAVRHGRHPVDVEITDSGHSWLLEVRDAAGDRPPTPDVGRDAALGGLGLPLVAQICSSNGWTTVEGRKIVWAAVDHAPSNHPGEAPAPLSGPRAGATTAGSGRDREI